MKIKVKCRHCKGSGDVLDYRNGEVFMTWCYDCDGVGEVEKEEAEVKQFSDLTFDEKAELEVESKARAKREGRDLLDDVVCAWRPMPGCTCGCNAGASGRAKGAVGAVGE